MSSINTKNIAVDRNLTKINENTYLKIFIDGRDIGNISDKAGQNKNAQFFAHYESWKILCLSLLNLAKNNFKPEHTSNIYEIHFNAEIITYTASDNFKLAESHENDRALCNFLESIKKL